MKRPTIYCVPRGDHGKEAIRACLAAHPEIRFVSLAGLDIYGHDTDEKIPVRLFLSDLDDFLAHGVQTDGSSVLLPGIADISNARIDILPDPDCDWYVDYNYQNEDAETGCPVGTLRIPALLRHNEATPVGSRVILSKACKVFREELCRLIAENPYVLEYLPFDAASDIEEIELTSATEMEFYVRTPHELVDRTRLHTSQEMKEQYWKRTVGPVRTALERAIELLECYGYQVEMGHKEVGGVKPELAQGGEYDHIMEQLELDWKYADPMTTADRDYQARYLIKDVFRGCGLDVTFNAKPIAGVAGSGKHTHFGVAAKLKSGKRVNLFTALDPDTDFMSPVGYGALMGLLKNYDIVSPMVSASNDAFNRLKPGYEAPVCTVTSLGHSVGEPSRNRTVLAGLIRDRNNPMATRFELRSPNPKSNTYLVLASGLLAMLDGIRAALSAAKTPAELCASISKEYGAEDFYLRTDRIYRVENNIFSDYSSEERERLFGPSPATVWEALALLDREESRELLATGGVMSERDIASYRAAALNQWATELHDRIVPAWRAACIRCVRLEDGGFALDGERWRRIDKLRRELAKDTAAGPCLLSRLAALLDAGRYAEASDLQIVAGERVAELEALYATYKNNIF